MKTPTQHTMLYYFNQCMQNEEITIDDLERLIEYSKIKKSRGIINNTSKPHDSTSKNNE